MKLVLAITIIGGIYLLISSILEKYKIKKVFEQYNNKKLRYRDIK